jgi:hypothetical protein
MTYGNGSGYGSGPALPLKMIIDGGSKKPQPRPLTPSELSERWPTSPPDVLALPPGTWVHRNAAIAAIAKANGCPGDLERGAGWLQSMVRLGLCDCQQNEVKLFSESEKAGTPRPGSPEAVNEEARLSRLRSDLAALGLKAVPVEPPA